ncbi:MAG TPA: universal stress protein [Steroidobacteraceae bacterium]|nr:universal stress protein [Steroidobacteraceae bacterium]
MKAPKNILVVVDPTAKEQNCVAKAAALARRSDAEIELFICDYEQSLSGKPFFDTDRLRASRENFLAERRELLERLAQPLRAEGVEVAVDAAWDNPLHEGICRKAASSHADLLVKDTHYHSLLRRTLITNTDWHLIRSCPIPMLLTKAASWSDPFEVVAAVDPGHLGDKPASLDREILAWGQWLTEGHGALHAVHMHFPSSLVAASVGVAGVPIAAAGGTADQLIQQEQEQRLKDLRELVEPFGIAPERVHLKLGTAADLLPEEAQQLGADVVVMGAVSRSRLQTVFVGSTAEKVLDRLPCDVLIIKPLDFKSDLPF